MRKVLDNINCVICETEFTPYSKASKYCCESCRWKGVAMNRDAAAAERRKARMVNWNSANREHRRNYHYKRLYGITLAEYNEMLEAQKGSCAICGEPPKEHHRSLAVDHDHNTGEIFGLLCTPCNKNLIGRIRNPALFERAAEYLRNGSGKFVPEEFKKGQKKKRRAKRPRKVKNDQTKQ